MIQVAVMGYGTIGSGVVEVLETNKDKITEKTGKEIAVKYILDLREFPGDPHEAQIVHDFEIIEKDEEVEIVVEAMGGVNPAYKFAKACLLAGKHVVTSNKALVAAHGTELLAIAREKNLNFLFEASVGGGIPLLRPLTQSLAGEKIEEISGILNGTTNFILTEMTNKGADFDTVLKEAQQLGYAEADPTADVEGYDACRKIAILTSLAYGKTLDFNDVYTEGITKITDRDIVYAGKIGAKVKIFGSSKKDGDRISAKVAPVLIYPENPLYSVDDVFNAILVKGNMVGDVMFYGQGAGKLATASAVVSDVMEVAKNIGKCVEVQWSAEKIALEPFEESKSSFFVRLRGDKSQNAAKVKEAFGDVTEIDAGYADEYAFITGEITEGAYASAADSLGNVINKIRVPETK